MRQEKNATGSIKISERSADAAGEREMQGDEAAIGWPTTCTGPSLGSKGCSRRNSSSTVKSQPSGHKSVRP